VTANSEIITLKTLAIAGATGSSGGHSMDHDYTAYEYLPECKKGCGKITGWLHSREMAKEVAENHTHQTGHEWRIIERMKE